MSAYVSMCQHVSAFGVSSTARVSTDDFLALHHEDDHIVEQHDHRPACGVPRKAKVSM